MLINEYQATCWKYLERGQEKSDENCRMGMDGRTREESHFDVELNEISLKCHHPKIAPYTDVVSYLMQCNMDVKFVGTGEAAKAFLYYVTDYITKASLSVHVGMSALSYAVKKIYTRVPGGLTGLSDEEAKGAVITAINSMMGRQEISQPQVMSYLIGGGDHYKSHKFVVLQWGVIRMYSGLGYNSDSSREAAINAPTNTDSTPYPDSVKRDAGDGPVSLTLGSRTITASSQYFDYVYRSNDDKFDGLCLYDFVGWTSKMRYSKSDNRTTSELAGAFTDQLHPQYTSHYLILRRSCHVPVILGPTIQNPQCSDTIREEWSRDMLMLFRPWRLVSDLKGVDESWSEAFTIYEPTLSPFHLKVIKNMRNWAECGEARDRHRERVRGKPNHSGEISDENNNYVGTDLGGDADGIDCDEPGDLDPFRVLECDDSSQEVYISGTGDILSDSSSRLLDMCLPIKMDDVTCRDELASTKLSLVTSEDLPQIAQHLAVMQLKRKHRRSDDLCDDTSASLSTSSRDEGPIAKKMVLSTGCEFDGATSRIEYTIAQSVVEELGIGNNEKQLKAFNIISRQLIEKRETQLLMHVAGVGGTGKSHVIKAVVLLFERLGRRRELLLGAPTGIAAVLIHGQTLHSLINLTPNGKRTNVTQLTDTWKYVKFLIVDEVSMIGARFLSQLSNRIRQGKGDSNLNREKPFGGVNVIFMGDFGQLKPPRQYALYANELVKNPSFSESRNNQAISAMDGVFLWRQVRSVVRLVKNQRHSDDPEYAAFLSRLRVGECIVKDGHGGSDLEYLRTRLIDNQARNVSVLEEFRDAPIIVGSKSLRDLLNVKLVKYHARRSGTEPVLYFSSDSMNRCNVDPRLRQRLWGLPSSTNKEALGRLPLFVGMKVMITENLAFGDGIVNGSEGWVTEIKYDKDDAGRRYAKVVYVHVPGCGMQIEGLERDVVPIFPVVTRVEHGISDPRFNSRIISRRQVPVVPAYVYTDYKSQGRTLSHVIVDLSTARGQGVYVMLSRVRSLSGLLILRWFSPNKIYHRLSEELRTELTRINEIALNTTDI